MNHQNIPSSNQEPIHVWSHEVSAEEIDRLGHANNVEYIRWMQMAAISHSWACGWPPVRYEEMGVSWVVHNHEITYLKPTFEGEPIQIRTWVGYIQRASSRRFYRIERPDDGTLLARARTDWVFINSTTGSPRRIPPEIENAFAILNILPNDPSFSDDD